MNSGGQLQISRPAPEPPNNRVNGGHGGQGGGNQGGHGGNVYQQPHQHNNGTGNGTYDTYGINNRQDEER